MPKYRVLAGIDYPPDRRVEIGDEVTDLPASAVSWLLECGAIEAVAKTTKAAVADPEPTPEDVPAEPVAEETVA